MLLLGKYVVFVLQRKELKHTVVHDLLKFSLVVSRSVLPSRTPGLPFFLNMTTIVFLVWLSFLLDFGFPRLLSIFVFPKFCKGADWILNERKLTHHAIDDEHLMPRTLNWEGDFPGQNVTKLDIISHRRDSARLGQCKDRSRAHKTT